MPHSIHLLGLQFQIIDYARCFRYGSRGVGTGKRRFYGRRLAGYFFADAGHESKGIGTGKNNPFYPEGVDLTGIGIIVLIAIFWPASRRFNRNNSATPREPGKTAPDILKERYARSKINKQEFEERKRDLE